MRWWNLGRTGNCCATLISLIPNCEISFVICDHNSLEQVGLCSFKWHLQIYPWKCFVLILSFILNIIFYSRRIHMGYKHVWCCSRPFLVLVCLMLSGPTTRPGARFSKLRTNCVAVSGFRNWSTNFVIGWVLFTRRSYVSIS